MKILTNKKIQILSTILLILTTSILNANTNLNKVSKSTGVSITIYNNNIAMVNDARKFNIKNNKKQKLIYEGIASSVIHESIIPTFSKPTTLYSQNYQYDVLSLNKLLQKNLNKTINYRVKTSDYGYKKEEGLLLSVNPILIKTKNEIISSINKNDILFNKIPNDLLIKPSLVWNIKPSKGEQELKLNYLTTNISWKSDYIINLDEKNSLNAWISINNNSGVKYDNASIYCIAGEVNTKKPKRVVHRMYEMDARKMGNSPEVKQKAFAGYHLYKIPFKETINNNEKKQINFINRSDIKIDSIASLDNSIYLYKFKKIKNQKFQHVLELHNNKESGLGLPLPSGTVRVYKKDEKISHFIGQDNIKHTSKNEKISLTIGKFFDISQDIEQLRLIRNKTNGSSTYQRTIYNKTNKEKTIVIKESNYSNNIRSIVNNSRCANNCSVKKDGLNTYIYTIKMQKNSKYELTHNYNFEYFVK